MEFKKIAKCTGKALAKTALGAGGVACVVGGAFWDAAGKKAAEKNGEEYTGDNKDNALSRWFFKKAKEINIKE